MSKWEVEGPRMSVTGIEGVYMSLRGLWDDHNGNEGKSEGVYGGVENS